MRKNVKNLVAALVLIGGLSLFTAILFYNGSKPVRADVAVSTVEPTPSTFEIGREFRLTELVPPRNVGGLVPSSGYVRLEVKSEVFQDFMIFSTDQYRVNYKAAPGRCTFTLVEDNLAEVSLPPNGIDDCLPVSER